MEEFGALARTRPVWTVALAALASFFMARSLALVPFFLVPLALAALSAGPRVGWISAGVLLLANLAFTVLSGGGADFAGLVGDFGYFAAVLATFVWAVAGPVPRIAVPRLRLAYRMVLAGLVSAGVAGLVMVLAGSSLKALFLEQASKLVDLLKQGEGSDAVERSLLESSLTPELLLESSKAVALRSAVFLHAVFFALNWRIAVTLAGFRMPGLRRAYVFSRFRLEGAFVWVFLPSLALVLLGFVVDSPALDAVAWNLALSCALLYAAQGLGVLDYNLGRPQIPRIARLGALVAIFLVALRPGANVVLVAALVVLGVTENWLPLRAPIQTEPPSTPEA